MVTSYAGQLAVATPRLIDPNFARSVVLLLDHDDDGALGVVINRPSELPLQAVLPGWAEAVSEPRVLFAGGPVSPESALAVTPFPLSEDTIGLKALPGGFALIDLDLEPADVRVGEASGPAGLRVFSGYAGWGAGQLEEEIEEGSWYVVSTLPADVLDPSPERLWRSVLARQPGELAYVATYPDDPTMN